MKFILLVIATLLVASLNAEKKSYRGYKLIRFQCQSGEQLRFIDALQSSSTDFDIWNLNVAGLSADVLISPASQEKYIKIMTSRNISFKIINQDIQDAMDQEEKSIMDRKLSKNSKNIQIDTYLRHSEINTFLLDINEKYPDLTTTQVIGTSFQNRQMRIITISAKKTNDRHIFMDCGIHAREWVSPATCVYTIDTIIKDYLANKQVVVDLLNKYTVHILPSLNPDGYEYSHTNNRNWRKNRAITNSTCVGVDLNRNCDWKWASISGGSSNLTCSDTYHGPSRASEIETKNLNNYLEKLRGKTDAYYSIHSYGCWWLLSFGDKTRPSNYNKQLDAANVGKAAYTARNNQKITVGNSAELLYDTSGSTSDCAHANFNIPYSYVLELRPGQAGDDPDSGVGFVYPVNKLPLVQTETYDALIASWAEISKELP